MVTLGWVAFGLSRHVIWKDRRIEWWDGWNGSVRYHCSTGTATTGVVFGVVGTVGAIGRLVQWVLLVR
jgi:hypothetical protein